MIFPKIPSILSQAYTLSPLRDDRAVLQHHPYQIPRITYPLYLAKRQPPVASLYYDCRGGNVKAVFNLDINFIIAQILGHADVNLAQSIITDLRRFGEHGPASYLVQRAAWHAQLGADWEIMLQRPHGVITVGILITLDIRFQSFRFVNQILDMLRAWFERGGYDAIAVRPPNAVLAGVVGASVREGRSITERQTVGARSDSKFCISPIQNWIFVVMPGNLDGLLPPLITC